jgi:hypothetical protein
MDKIQISCTLKDVNSFLSVFPSDMLPRSITRPSTVIGNADAHTQTESHWLAIRLEPRSSTAFYFDSYSLSPHIHDIETFLRRNCTVLDYNTIELQGPLSIVCRYRFRNLVYGTRRGSGLGSFRGGRICPRNILFPTPIHHGAPWLDFFRD